MFNGLVLGALLALISSGLTIIYGTLGVLNLAHGAMFMLGGYAGYVAYQATRARSSSRWSPARCSCMVVGVRDGARHHPPLLHRPHEDQLLVTFGTRHRHRRDWCASSSAACRRRCRRRRCCAGITSLGFMFYPTYRLALVGIVAVALLRAVPRALPHPARHDRARRHRGFGDGRFARHQRLPRLHDGVRHRRHGGGLRRHRQRAGRVAHARHGRGDPGADLRRGRDRRRRLVPRRGARRADRRRDHQHHLDGQSRLRLRHAVRRDDAGAVLRPHGLLGARGRE